MSAFRIALLTVAALFLSFSPRASAQGIPPAGMTYGVLPPGNPSFVSWTHFNKKGTCYTKDINGGYCQGIWGMDNNNILYVRPDIYTYPKALYVFKGFNAFGTNINQFNTSLVFVGY